MPTTLICPSCGSEGVVHLKQAGGHIELTYDCHAKARRCVHPAVDSMANCPHMQPILQLLLSQVRQPNER
jgi:hypothetical protein